MGYVSLSKNNTQRPVLGESYQLPWIRSSPLTSNIYFLPLATFKEDDIYILLLWLLYCIFILISPELGGVMTSLPATCPLQEELQQPPRQQLRSQVFSTQQTTFNRTFLIGKRTAVCRHNKIPRHSLHMIKTHTTLSCTRKNLPPFLPGCSPWTH